jgi:hypothetical protein
MRSTEQGGFSAFAPGKQLETWAGRAWVNDTRTRFERFRAARKTAPVRAQHRPATRARLVIADTL